MHHCTQCGSLLQPNAKFCGQCGHVFSKKRKVHITPIKKWLLGSLVGIFAVSVLTFMYVLPYLATKGISFLPIYKGDISGVVYKTDGKTPFEGVEIRLKGTSEKSRSDSSGKFYFFEVPVGNYKLQGKNEGHRETETQVKVVHKSSANASLTLPVNPVGKGTKILAEKVDKNKATTEIWIMDQDGSNKRRLLEGSQPEILDGGTEMIVTKSGKRYQAYVDGSGEQLVGTEAPPVQTSNNRVTPLPQKSTLSPDKTKTGLIESGDIWILKGSDKARLTSINENSLEGLFWVSNDQLLYLMRKEGKFIVSTINIQTKETKEIFNDNFSIYWSYDHKYFAVDKYTSGSCSFCSDDKKKELQDKQKDNGIWIYKIADGSSRKITDSSENIYQYPAWIPDSSLLTYFVDDSKNKENNGLYLVDANDESSQGKLILKDTNNIDFTDAAWSMKKDALVTKSGYLVKLDGSPAKRITDKSAQFNWLPSGKVIYTITTDKTTWITANGDDQKKLTDYPLNLNYSLSNDKRMVLTDGGGYIWTMDENGDNLKQLTTDVGYKNPQWL